jgi:hypothetical protein
MSSKRNYESRSEKIVASPRFSQNTGEDVDSSQLHNNRDLRNMQKSRSRNQVIYFDDQDTEYKQLLEQPDVRSNPDARSNNDRMASSGREGLNMNFNT